MRTTLIALTTILTLGGTAAAQSRGLMPADFYNEVAVGDVAISPTGDLVAFTVTTIDEQENSRHREIWMHRLSAGAPEGESFRFTTPTESSSGPRWSPDGAVVSFTSRREGDSNDVWFARVRAPGGEAYHVEGVRGAPIWSPDGRWVAFVAEPDVPDDDNAPEDADDRREGWIAPDAITTTLDADRFDGRVLTFLRYKRDGTQRLLAHRSSRDTTQLFVVSADGGDARQLTRLPFDVGEVTWSPDGSTLLFTGDERQHDELNAEPTYDMYAIGRDGGEPRRLTRNPGSERAPTWSRDGQRVAFLSTPARGAETDLLVVEVAPNATFRGETRNLTERWDLRPGTPEWTAGGNIRFRAGIRGNAHVFEISPSDGEVRPVTSGSRQLSAISSSRDGTTMAYAATDATTPAEVFVAAGDDSGAQRVTSFNDAWLADVSRMPAEPLTWRVADGTEIEGWVIKPVGYEPGRSYPLVLKIHGGPHGAYGNTFFRTFHVLSASGFFVLYPNPRGSSNYGHDFMYATRGRWGELDQEDYLTGVDAALATYPDIDPARIGVSGGSYGGYMTNWLTATTDRFAAAVTSRSIVNWESWYGDSDAQGLTDYEFFGPPWEQRELYRRLSPISYVEGVTAPTLIIHSENDYRTPIGDGEQWFTALMKRGIPTELVRYPRSSHGLSRSGEPWLLVDRLERLRSWLTHWLIAVPEESTTARNDGRNDHGPETEGRTERARN